MSKIKKIKQKIKKPQTPKPLKKDVAKKGTGSKWLAVSLGLAATGALSYFGFQYWKKNKAANNTNSNDIAVTNTGTETSAPAHNAPIKPKYTAPKEPATKDAFPLAKGSKGDKVKAFQQALITKYGKSILPKYGADGDFGSEMSSALKKAGLSDSITETTFNLLVKGASPDHTAVAKDLYTAAKSKDFNKAIGLLKTLRNTDDYKAVSDTFVNYRIGNVRQTLVNGMLNSFNDAKQKDAIRLAFSNMGLKYDGNKWSLGGIEDTAKKLIITLQNTEVWKNPCVSVAVPANMVLGGFITTRGNYTLFENEQHYFLVNTQHIKAYN